MFYLEKCIQLFQKSPLKSIILFLGMMTLFVVAGQKEVIQKKFNIMLESEKEYPYFYALISTKNNAQKVRRQLVQLPGVKEVQFISHKTVTEKVKNILKDVGVDENNPYFNYEGLKVSLSLELPPKGSKLIRDYLKRLVDDELILSSMQGVGKVKKDSYFTSFFKNWGWEVTVVTLFAFNIFLFFFSILEQGREFYLYEEFSRKKNVGLKTFSILISIIFIVSLIPLVTFKSVSWLGPVLIFILFQLTNLMNVVKTQWD